MRVTEKNDTHLDILQLGSSYKHVIIKQEESKNNICDVKTCSFLKNITWSKLYLIFEHFSKVLHQNRVSENLLTFHNIILIKMTSFICKMSTNCFVYVRNLKNASLIRYIHGLLNVILSLK